MEKKKDNRIAFLMLFGMAIVIFFRYFENGINPQDTTAFAITYKNGFVSRGFMGSVLYILDQILPQNLMSYQGVYWLSIFGTIMYFAALAWFFYIIQSKIEENEKPMATMLMIFLGIICFPMYLSFDNFGRLDVYLTVIMILCVNLLLLKKGEWLLIPLTIIAMLIHQGYVFMNVNIVLLLLFYYVWLHQGKERKKYIVLLLSVFFICSFFFLYFEFFSHGNGAEAYDEIYQLAVQLSMDGKSVNESLLKHEVLGLDVYEDEYWFRQLNYFEFPIFMLLYFPIWGIGLYVVTKIMKATTNRKEKFLVIIALLGGLTLLPEFILKVDYGRYVFALLLYYGMVYLCWQAIRKDCKLIDKSITYPLLEKNPCLAGVLLCYAVCFPPYRAVRISDVVNQITYFVHGFH